MASACWNLNDFLLCLVSVFVSKTTLAEYIFIPQPGFLRRFRDPIRIPRISNRVPRHRKNYDQVHKIRENRVPTDPYQVPNIFLKKNPAHNKSFFQVVQLRQKVVGLVPGQLIVSARQKIDT